MLDDDVDVDRPLRNMDCAIYKFMGETNKSKDIQDVEERILYILLRERIPMLWCGNGFTSISKDPNSQESVIEEK